MNRRIVSALLLSALFCVTASLNAQEISFGVGAGWGRVSCDVCQTSRDLGPTAYVRFARVLNPSVRVGGEATAWTHEVEDERENLAAVMAVLTLQPPRRPLFVKAGVGYVGYRAGEDISLNSIGMQVGGGYELRLGGLAISNYVNVISSSFGSLKNESTTIANDVSTTLLQLGVGVTIK